MNLTQRELAARSGVTWSSLKRFEREGLIALDSLLNLALALNLLDDFDKLAVESQPISAAQSLDALLAKPTLRRRATGRKGRIHGI
jgi:transcriptional regulator with XRE-family HTH domain